MEVRNLTSGQKLDALVWAAKEKGMTYGALCSVLTPAEKHKIFDDYTAFLKIREENRPCGRRAAEAGKKAELLKAPAPCGTAGRNKRGRRKAV